MAGTLSFDLHLLTTRLDRAADRLLREAHGLSYSRFLALLLVNELGNPTQRALAEALGVSEPSVSRMTEVLGANEQLRAAPDAEGGNRRRLHLTSTGRELVQQCRELLECRFAGLVERSGVSYADYAHQTRSLLAALDAGEESAS